MSFEAEEILVAATGHIWRAPVGTAFPADISVSVDETLWTELGYTSEQAPRFRFGRETTSIRGWQSKSPLRILVTSTPRSVAADLLQTNMNTWNTAMGGGTWTTQASGKYKWTPPSANYVDEFAAIVELIDDSEILRLCYRRCFNQAPTEFTTPNNAPLMLPVDFAVLQPDGGLDPFEVYTNIDDLGLFNQAGS